MPRKRLDKNVAAAPAPEPTPEPPTDKPKRTRARSPKATPAAAVAVAEELNIGIETAAAVAEVPVEAPPAKKSARGRAKKVEAPTPQPATESVTDSEPPVEFRPRTNRPRASKAKDEPVEATPAVAEAEAAPIEKPGRGSRRRKQAEVPDATAPVVADWKPDWLEEALADDLPIPAWRARTGSKPVAGEPAEGGESEPQLSPRRSRRRRKDHADREITAAAALEPAGEEQPAAKPERRGRRDRQRPEKDQPASPVAGEEEAPTQVAFRRREEKLPVVPPKPMVPTPDDAPQVVLRDGVPTLVRKGRVYPPIMFFGTSSDERRAATVLDELRMAGDAGVHLHSYLVDLEVDPQSVDSAVSLAAYMLVKSVEVDPESQVIFRVVFRAPRGWQDRYPKARFQTQDDGLAEPSVCDDDFWGVARECLSQFVRKLRLLPQKESVLGVHLERGEWFIAAGWGYDTSQAARDKFRDWARLRYLNDEVALRANWFDGQVRFDTLTIPPYQPEGSEGDRFVRSSRKQRRYVDYHLFLSDATVQRIGDLAYAAKEASEGYFLVGASYGYTFEWSHPASGHLALGKLLRTPEIDFIAGPPSYRNREPGGTAPFPGPIDSFALNGKLYISEEDFKTSLSGGHEPDDFNPVIKTPQALESVHWRGAGAALAHGSGVCWMDLWGNGWLKTPTIWERASRIQEDLTQRMGCGIGEPEVVVFIDERALAYLVDQNAFKLLVQNARESVLRAGVNAGFYLLSDLAHREKFPEAKLYMFLNAWDIRPELRAAIKSRLQRDNKVLFWLYSAGLFDAGRESLERAREVTGIALKPQPFYSKSGTTILNRRHALCEAFPDRSVVGGSQLEPSYFAIPEEALVLGEYSQTGLPSFIVKESNEGDAGTNWTSVFMGEPVVNAALIRALAQMAGAHVYNFREDVVHVRPPFLTVHCDGAGPRTITLPNKWSAYNVHTSQWAAVDSTNLRFTANDGSTHVFLVGPREELEVMLARDPSDILRMDVLPAKPDNTLRQDGVGFDVPIMKLDEWIEGAEPDEVADEWFLRPQQIVATEQPDGESEKVGRRRRRRGRRGPGDRTGGGTEEPTMTRHEYATEGSFDDVGMNVVFRKRD